MKIDSISIKGKATAFEISEKIFYAHNYAHLCSKSKQNYEI